MIARKLRFWHLSIIVVIGVLLAGCGGGAAAALTGSSWPGLATSEEAIYMAFGPSVYAIDPASGERLWQFPDQPARGQTFYAPPAVAENTIVVGDYRGWVYAIDPTNGRELWSFQAQPTSRFVGGATIGEEYVYAGTVAGVMYALDRETGSEAWRFTADRDIWSAPLLQDGTLYFTTLDRHLYALDAATGDVEWQFPSQDVEDGDSPVGPMVGKPTYHEGVLYFGSFNNRVIALDTETHEPLWTYETSNWVWDSPALDEDSGLLIGGDVDGNVFALDRETGEEVWKVTTDGPVVSTPTLAEKDGQRVVYVTSGDSKLYTLRVEDGSEVDTPLSITAEFTQRFLVIPTGTSVRPVPVYAPPLVLDDMVYVGPHQGNNLLLAYERDSLRQAWTFNPAADS